MLSARKEEMLRRVKEDVLKHGFQALFIKDWDGKQGKMWQLSSCASDCACSPACNHCPVVLLQQKKELETGVRESAKARFLYENLLQPLKWTNRHMVFVCPQGDLFHHDITDEDIASVFAVMHTRPQDCYLVLTKRAERLKNLLCSPQFGRRVLWKGKELFGSDFNLDSGWGNNLLVGVSVEDQKRMERAMVLPQLPKKLKKVLFAAPLLEEIVIPDDVLKSLSWVVCNRERGSTYCDPRPCNIEWIKSLWDQCSDAGVPFFLEDRWSLELNGTFGGQPRQYPSILAR